MSAALVLSGRRGAEHARQLLARRPVRRSLLVAAAALQVFVLVSAVAWWTASPVVATTASQGAPATWTGVVHDVGAAGVNLRSLPAVLPDTSRDSAARGSRLPIVCAQNGDVVSAGTTNTSVWLKTTDEMWVSLLYVRVAGKTTIASCTNDQQNMPLIAITDPANPTPGDAAAAPVVGGSEVGTGCPEGATCQASGAGESISSGAGRGAGGGTTASTGGSAAVAPAGRAPGGTNSVGTGKASAVTPTKAPSTVAPGKQTAGHTPPPPTSTAAEHATVADPDVTPVG